MTRQLIFCGIALMICACNGIQRLYTVFPEAREQIAAKPGSADVIRIYFDRVGYIYPAVPGVPLTDQGLRYCDSRLARYYSTYPDQYEKICAFYHAAADPVSDTSNTYEISLQTALVKEYTDQINRQVKNRTLVFLIHGFNSNPLSPDGKGAYDEFKRTRDLITGHFKGRAFLFVEIYWDGLDDTNGFQNTVYSHLNDLKIWPHAQASATYTGLELRRILSGLSSPHIDVLTHSHGAGVITTALFDSHKFDKRKGYYESLYNNPDSWLSDIKAEYNHPEYNSPTQDFTIGMLAPAIPGWAVFHEYGNRTIGGTETPSKMRNFHFIVGFNENDPVTSKFKLLAKGYGSTTLACSRRELRLTEKLFDNDPAVLTAVDFSVYQGRVKHRKQNDHSWFTYLAHSPEIGHFLDLTIK